MVKQDWKLVAQGKGYKNWFRKNSNIALRFEDLKVGIPSVVEDFRYVVDVGEQYGNSSITGGRRIYEGSSKSKAVSIANKYMQTN